MWIARDKDGSLNLFNDHPKRYKGSFDYEFFAEEDTLGVRVDDKLFSEVTWENSPKKVKNIKIELEDEND